MTSRQVDILLGSHEGETLAVAAERLRCSPATVLNEQRRVGAILRRLSGDDEEQHALLNITLDLLYLATDAQ
jgi:hypothetical protein